MAAFGTGTFGAGVFGVGDGAVDPALIGTPSTGTAVNLLAFLSFDVDPLDCPLAAGTDATFEDSSTWNAANGQTTFAYDTGRVHAGTASRLLTRTTSTGPAAAYWQSAPGSVTALRWYGALIYISPETTARTGQATITFQTAGSGTLTTVTSTAPQVLGQWRPLLVVGQAPAGVNRLRVDVAINNCTVGEQHRIDTFACDHLGTLLAGRVRDVSWRRGRNDELGQVQASTCTVALKNSDGYLTPDSVTAPAPYLGNIDSNRRIVIVRQVDGVLYPEWAGTTESWEQSIHANGAWSEVQVQATDAFDWFGKPILPPLPAEIMLDEPDAYFRLNEPKEAVSAGSIAGDSGIATLATSKYGASGSAFGADNAAPVLDTGKTADDGQPWLTLNPNTVPSATEPGSVLDFSNVPAANPATNPTVGWTVEIWARLPTTAPTETMILYRSAAYAGGFEYHSGFQLQMETYGALTVRSPTTTLILSDFTYVSSTPTTLMFALTWSPSGGTYGTLTLKTSYEEKAVALGSTPYTAGTPDRVWVGGYFQSYRRSLQYAWRTPIAHVAFWRRAVDTGRLGAHSQVGRSGGLSESEGNRIGGVANLAGWPEAWTRIDVGLSSLMDRSWASTTALSLIQDIAKQSSALVIADVAGKLVMRNRHARVNVAAKAVFRAADGTAITARDFTPKKDNQFVENSIKVTRTTGATTVASDAASIARYGLKPADDIEVAIDSDEEAAALGKWRVATRKDNRARVSSLALQPGARPALWPILLGLEVGDRISVQGLPSLAPWQTLDAFVESIESRQDGNPRNTVYVLGLSPWRAELHQMAQLDTGGNLSLLGAADCQAGWY
ncbi:hypothetical protein [Frankia sp. AgB32]|uniref:hypothetical protein n=1 Tax=Frankia sp. AgB32 TaxID=631119 RepID=UPI00200ED4CD|nr:hypothetical protein [Frankia sp. AgB32]MCK9896979.1 hypothetical protein [Frankia sp. AgB32]